MNREYEMTRAVTRSYVIDDGWNVPTEIVEMIDLKIEQAKENAYKQVCKANRAHKGSWLTREVARNYAEKAAVFLSHSAGQNIDMVRGLMLELMEKYDVTEVEATNILNNRHISDYVRKYEMIEKLMPVFVNEQYICDEILSENGYAYMDDDYLYAY